MNITQDAPIRASLPTHPPSSSPPRPTLIDRIAMHVGLRLLLWGRDRSRRRVSLEANTRALLAQDVRRAYDLAVVRTGAQPTIR
ncbi:hypothetical protein SK224_07660 [Microbacterium sp. BG28]|uniref:hypothetical protein n=1 Tax=Microbacterium sp. BG28 TaxID=3097356 RepID=UPI002A5A3D29|nr:hypothetical protein [Microbacterium sp. BG28]MDY0829001.1 hypothetical protein [Microbacterium sp. BG28]